MSTKYAAAFHANEIAASNGSVGGHYTGRAAEIIALNAYNMVFLDVRPLAGTGADANFVSLVAADLVLYAAAGYKVMLLIGSGTLNSGGVFGNNIADATSWANLLASLATLIDPADTNPTVYGFSIDEHDPAVDALYLARTTTLRGLYPYVRTHTLLQMDLGAHAAGTFAYTTDMGMDYYFFTLRGAGLGPRTRADYESRWVTLESYASGGQDLWVAPDTYIAADPDNPAAVPPISTMLVRIVDSINYHLYWASGHARVVGIVDFEYCGDAASVGYGPLYGVRQINDAASLAYSASTIHWLQTMNRYWMGTLASTGQLYGGGTYPVDAYIGGEWNPSYATKRAYTQDTASVNGGEPVRPLNAQPEVSRL